MILLFLPLFSYGQNIVANSDFSDINICIEYGAKCAPEAWLLASPNLPLYKNDVVGITVFNTGKANVRQYLQTELLMEMEAGKEYEIKIRLKAGDAIVNSIGVKFNNEFICLKKDDLIENPSVDFSPQLGSISKRKQRKWMELNYTYTAFGGEKFILIGCFSPQDKQKRSFKNNALPYKNYYYFFNQVEVVPKHVDTLPQVCEDVRKHLYSHDYRHSFCMYNPYQTPINDTIDNDKRIERINTVSEDKSPIIDRVVFGDVLFDFNSSDLKPEATNEILLKLDQIIDDSLTKVEIYGYTDNVGSDKVNIKLSQKRAEAVKRFLIKEGVKKDLIKAVGMGSDNPIADNTTEEGRAKNRRIEILFEYR